MRITNYVLCFILCSSSALGGNGSSIVGNGAGLVEQDIQYAYSSLKSLLKECGLSAVICDVPSSSLPLLNKMTLVIDQNFNNPKRIIFVSEKENPGFFTTSSTERHRIAKTGLDATVPIYFNSDLLYKEDGTPAIDYPTAIALITHEVGHQAGEPDHARLDILASVLKRHAAKKFENYVVEADDVFEESFHVTILNHAALLQQPDVFFNWGQNPRTRITTNITEKISCANPRDTLIGYKINNGHFLALNEPLATYDNMLLRFRAWIYAACSSGETVSMRRTHVVTMEFQLGLGLTGLEVVPVAAE